MTLQEPAARDCRATSARTLLRELWPEDGRQILGALALYKLVFFAVVYLATNLFPVSLFNVASYQTNFIADPLAPITNLTRLATWDAQHYLFLSESGWLPDNRSSAFYPMVPALIKIGGAVFGNNIIGGLVLCNLFSLVGFYVFFLFARREFGPAVGLLGLMLMLAFPGGVFFQLLYSEAPSVFFVSLFFYFLTRDNYRAAAVAAFFLPLCRGVGLFAIVPFAWTVFVSWRKGETGPYSLIWALSPLMGWGFYFFVIFLYTGNPFEMFRSMRYFGSGASVWNIFDVPLLVKETLAITYLHDYKGSLIDRLWMIPIIPALFLLWKKDNKAYFLYALVMVMVPVMTGRYTSFTRYVVLAFPIFLIYAEVLYKSRLQLHRMVIAFFLGLQTLFVLRYVNNYWVG